MTHPWDLPAREITPESAVLFAPPLAEAISALRPPDSARPPPAPACGGGTRAATTTCSTPAKSPPPPTSSPPTATPDLKWTVRSPTKAAAARYCNFYEFSSTKNRFKAYWVAPFQPDPWILELGGLVAKPRTLDIDDLLHTFAPSLEERVYRHRCVETWAMAVPWTGVPLAALLRRVEPLPGARFVRFISFDRPGEAGRQANAAYPWPYTEGLTLAEAGNELAFLAVGMYGHPLLKQHGAPVRLVLPWKYGFKSAKSIQRIELTAERPATFWNTLGPDEYGFTANVNPAVPHPRWSQATEHMLGTGEVRPTQPYNGYGEWVAGLYA